MEPLQEIEHFQLTITFWCSEKKGVMKKKRDNANDEKLKELVNGLKPPELHIILRAKNTGSWITMWGNTVTGAVLAAT